MKKIITIASALLLIAGALVSCQKEKLVEPVLDSNVPTSFTASFEQTKLTLDGWSPRFEKGDILSVRGNNDAAADFEFSEITEDGAIFVLKGSWSKTPTSPYYVYQGTLSNSMLAYNYPMINFNLPNLIMNPVAGNISSSLMYGKTDNLASGVTLQNGCALLKFEVTTPVKNVRITTGNDQINRQVQVNFQTGVANYASPIPYYQIGLSELPAGTYYLPITPTPSYAPLNGLKAGFTTDGIEYVWKEKSGNITIERNKIYDLGDVMSWAPAPFPVEDCVGTFKGSVKGNYNMNPTAVTSLEDVEFILEANNGECNVKLKSVGGLASNALGTLDCNTGLLTFAAGQSIPYPENYNLQVAAPLAEDLKLQFSEDKKSLTLVNSPCAINAMGYPGFYPQFTQITLARSGGSESQGFKITDLTGHSFSVSCKIDGTTYTGTMTFQTSMAPGANVYIDNIFGNPLPGYSCYAYALFDIETGNITLTASGGANQYKLPNSQETYHTDNTYGDNILVLSEDKKTITIHEDLNDMLWLYDTAGNIVTISNYIATRID